MSPHFFGAHMITTQLDGLNRFKNAASATDYGLRIPIPTSFELEFCTELPKFLDLTESDWATLYSVVDYNLYSELHTFAWRMASLAVRRMDQQYVMCGLLALVTNNINRDYRDDYMALSALYDAALRVDAGPLDLFPVAMRVASPSIKDNIQRFLARAPAMRTPDTFGVGTRGTGEAFSYILD